MTTLTVAPSLFDAVGGEPALGEVIVDAVGGEPTLDEMIVSVWEGLAAHRVVECPVCDEEMAPEYAAHARPIGGRCTGCGTVLR